MPVIAEMLKISTSLLNVVYHQNRDTHEAYKKAQEAGVVAKGAKADEIWTRGWKLTQLDLNYRHSPIVLDERADGEEAAPLDAYGTEGHKLCAGDRAPESPGLHVLAGLGTQYQTTKLFDILSPSVHTVLIFPAASEKEPITFVDSILQILKEAPTGLVRSVLVFSKFHSATETTTSLVDIDVTVKDTDGHAFTNYGAKANTASVVLIRPDAYVGGIVEDACGVRRYLSTVFNSVASV